MLWVWVLILSACSATTPSDFQRAGEAWARAFVADLEQIESREDLERAAPRIKRHYDRLSELVEEVAQWEKTHAGGSVPVEPTAYGDALYMELARVRELPGGKEILENCERESLRACTRLREYL